MAAFRFSTTNATQTSRLRTSTTRDPRQHLRKLPLIPTRNGKPRLYSSLFLRHPHPFVLHTPPLFPPSYYAGFPTLTTSASRAADGLLGREMGRGKIEIKRIENSTNRQVTYSKRKNGIIKKAMEISVLCNAKVNLVMFSSSGKMAEFCSDRTTLPSMLEEYQKHTGKRIWDAKHESLNAEIDRIKKENDDMRIELRHLEGEDITPLSPFELIPLEETLQKSLDRVREKQMEYLTKLQENGSMLMEQNKQLALMLQQALYGDAGELDQEYEDKGRDYPAQMPFSFHGQPIQPNLQESE